MVSIHLAFGQINIFLMLLVIADFARSPVTPMGKRLPRGVLIGIAAAIKLTPLLFIVYLAVIQ